MPVLSPAYTVSERLARTEQVVVSPEVSATVRSSFLTRQKTHDNYGLIGLDSKRLASEECIHITTVTDKTRTDLSLGAKD